MFDTHTHTEFSHDGSMTVDTICQSAIQRGLVGVTICDHADVNVFEKRNLLQNFRDRSPFIQRAKEAYRGKIRVLNGIELGQITTAPEKASLLLSSDEFDQIISSVHTTFREGNEISFSKADFGEGCTGEEIQEALDGYFDRLLFITENHDFDILAHLTYPFRYLNFKFGRGIKTVPFENQIKMIYRALIAQERCLEVNTSRFTEEFGYCLQPNIDLISLYFEMGGKHVSLGSDAHAPHALGRGFPSVLRDLKEIGFDHYCYYEKRQRKEISLI